jgi:hypothetical protein
MNVACPVHGGRRAHRGCHFCRKPICRLCELKMRGHLYCSSRCARDAGRAEVWRLASGRVLRPVSPRIAVAGLNPHAGDGGSLGREEIDVIAPAIAAMQGEGIDARGPLSPDTVFVAARRGDFDAVVSMYHDQGQIAMKLMGFERGVTLHGGLPVPVATCASGTAFDIVGRNVGNPEGLQEAFDLAAAIASRAHPGAGSASPAAALAA